MKNELLEIDHNLIKRGQAKYEDSKTWCENLPHFLCKDVEFVVQVLQYEYQSYKLREQFQTIYNYCLDAQTYKVACQEIMTKGRNQYHEEFRETIDREMAKWSQSSIGHINYEDLNGVTQREFRRRAQQLFFYEEFRG